MHLNPHALAALGGCDHLSMKFSGTCPKCSSTGVIRVPGSVGSHGAGENIAVGKLYTNSVLVTRYVCPQCGFIEHWVDSPRDIERVVKKFRTEKPSP